MSFCSSLGGRKQERERDARGYEFTMALCANLSLPYITLFLLSTFHFLPLFPQLISLSPFSFILFHSESSIHSQRPYYIYIARFAVVPPLMVFRFRCLNLALDGGAARLSALCPLSCAESLVTDFPLESTPFLNNTLTLSLVFFHQQFLDIEIS